jgi:hypothetical protein
MGKTVKHRSRVARDPTQPNLRQVHLIHAELFEELCEAGFDIAPGQMGENVTTSGVDLLELPTGTLLRLGEAAVIEVTGLRNPCALLDRIQPEGLGRPPSIALPTETWSARQGSWVSSSPVARFAPVMRCRSTCPRCRTSLSRRSESNSTLDGSSTAPAIHDR